MAGNVAEWTESAFDPMSDLFASDLNPSIHIMLQMMTILTLKKKVIKGGSWKDIGVFTN